MDTEQQAGSSGEDKGGGAFLKRIHLRSRPLTEGDPDKRCPIQLRGFKTEAEQRQSVIRYLTLEKFVSLLELEAIWFSRLGALQDRFEGTLPTRARELSEARDNDIADRLGIPFLRSVTLKMTDQSIEACRGTAAVNCWFLGENESEKMWREYGQNGTGVAIRSTVARLSNSFQITGDFAATTEIGRVQYVDFETHVISAEDSSSINDKAFLKEKSYAWEQEVRVMTLNCLHSGCLNPDGSSVTKGQFSASGPVDQKRKGFYIRCRLADLVQAVVVGPSAPAHFSFLVRRLVDRYRLPAKVENSSFS